MLCVLLFAAVEVPAAGRVIHKERSLYQTILVTKDRKRICLQFSVRREQRNQSCMNPKRPKEMIFPYTRMMLASLLVVPEPRRILVVGLGGGTLPQALEEIYPEARLTVLEIDPAVTKVAQEYFGYAPSARTEVVEQDARVFTKRTMRRIDADTEGYDLVMLDAFNGDYIPEHLLTREYLMETRALMRPGGVLAANTFALSQLYDHESTTYTSVFGKFLNLRLAETGNRVILAQKAGGSDLIASHDRKALLDVLRSRLPAVDPKLAPYGIRLANDLKRMVVPADWNPKARILTDQYAPGNILSTRPRS